MNDDLKTQEEGTKPTSTPDKATPPIPPASAVQANPGSEAAKGSQKPRRKKYNPILRFVRIIRKHRREFPKWTDMAIVILTAGIVFLAYMQHRDLIGAGTQTDKIIAADQRMATAMEGVLTQAQNTLDATVKQGQQEQRPWINIAFTDFHWSENAPLNVRMHLINSGRTPAETLRGHAIVEKISRGNVPHFSERYPGNDFGTGLLVPNLVIDQWAFQSLRAKGILWKASAPDVAEINRGYAYIAVHGIARYDDVYGRPHWIKFCSYSSGDMPAVQRFVSPCSNYNDVDK